MVTQDDVDKLEKLVDRPSKFADEFRDRIGYDKYSKMYADGFKDPQAMLDELKRQMSAAAAPSNRHAKKRMRIGKDAAAQNS